MLSVKRHAGVFFFQLSAKAERGAQKEQAQLQTATMSTEQKLSGLTYYDYVQPCFCA